MNTKMITKFNPSDNIAFSNTTIPKGDIIPIENKTITAKSGISEGDKLALVNIDKGTPIIKFNIPIGIATKEIKAGEKLTVFNYSDDIINLKQFENPRPYNDLNRLYTNKGYIPQITGYKNNDKIGIKKTLLIIARKEYETLVKPLKKPDEELFITDDTNNIKELLKHPNLNSAILVGFEGPYNDFIIAMENPDTENLKEALEKLREIKSKTGKNSYNPSFFSLEINGFFPNDYKNHMIGKIVDILISCKVRTMIRLPRELNKTLPLLKKRLKDPQDAHKLDEYSKANLVPLEKEIDILQIFGQGQIQKVITNSSFCENGLNILIPDEKDNYYSTAMAILDLSNSLKTLPLTKVIHYDFTQELETHSEEFFLNLFDTN